MASSQPIQPVSSMAFPMIDKVNITLFTQLSSTSEWLHQQFSLEQRFISGWDRASAMRTASEAGKLDKNGHIRPHRDYYGGGVHFLSDKCGYMDSFGNEKVEIPFTNPVYGVAPWGRFYSNIKNVLYFDLDQQFSNAIVVNGVEETSGTYRVQPGFQIARHYPQDDRQFVESTSEHMIRRPYCQALQVSSIVRKPGKA